jgi:hypothetical protein
VAGVKGTLTPTLPPIRLRAIFFRVYSHVYSHAKEGHDLMTTVYCTSPRSMYDTPAYGEMVLLALDTFADDDEEESVMEGDVYPSVDVIESREVFHSKQADWSREWPATRDEADVLLFMTDDERIIGSGVYREIEDMRKRGKPVYLALVGDTWKGRAMVEVKDGGLPILRLDEIRIDMINGGKDWARYARVSAS